MEFLRAAYLEVKQSGGENILRLFLDVFDNQKINSINRLVRVSSKEWSYLHYIVQFQTFLLDFRHMEVFFHFNSYIFFSDYEKIIL